MEYLISNKPFKNAKKFHEIFYIGNFQLYSKFFVIDGEIFNISPQNLEKMSIDTILKFNFEGLFTLIYYDIPTQTLYIKNDKMGEIPTYYYFHNEKFMISNNVWKIIENLDSSEIILDTYTCKMYLYFVGLSPHNNTFLKNLKLVENASEIYLNLLKNRMDISHYWHFEKQKKRDIDISQALKEMEHGLNKLFKYIVEKNKNKKFAFGNSGGLDSRLIAIHKREFNKMNLIGITISDSKSGLFKTNTIKQANKIAKICNIDNYIIDFRTNDYDYRNLLDIRNNPFCGSQIFKNPINKIPDFDILLTGHEGLLIGSGYGSAIKNIPIEKLGQFLFKRYTITYHEKQKTSLLNLLKKIFLILFNKEKKRFDQFKEENFNQYSQKKKNILDNVYPSKLIQKFQKDIQNFIDQYHEKGYSVLDIWRLFFLKKIMRYNYSGGFESLNRTKKTYYIYYPILFQKLETWPLEFLDDRRLLKEYIRQKSKKIGKIPGQDMESLDTYEDYNKFEQIFRGIKRLLKKIELKIRTKGLNYTEWYLDKNFQVYAKKVLKRENPYFSKIINIQKLDNEILFRSKLITKLIKLKRFLDIIYYSEYSLLKKDEFMIN